MLSGLYWDTESPIKCGGGVSDFFPVTAGVRQGCVLAPTLFNVCMDWVLGRTVDGSSCGASVGDIKVTDLDFADDAVIFAETLGVVELALETLSEESKPLGLAVSWAKTKAIDFGNFLGREQQSVHTCGEDIEILERFSYLGSAVHNTDSFTDDSAWPMVLWTHSTGVFGAVGIWIEERRYVSSRPLCSLSCSMEVRHGR